jgi:hypothetical protein
VVSERDTIETKGIETKYRAKTFSNSQANKKADEIIKLMGTKDCGADHATNAKRFLGDKIFTAITKEAKWSELCKMQVTMSRPLIFFTLTAIED